MHVVAILIDAGCNPFELAIGCEVFGLEREELPDLYETRVCVASGGKVSLGLFEIESRYGLADLRTADTIIVPSAWKCGSTPPEVLDELRAAHRRGARMVSFCSGTRVLAEAGLLEGRSAATHWLFAEELQDEYPGIDVRSDVLFVDEGDVLTSAGTSAGIDLALHMVRADHGARAANMIARRMVVPPQRDGDQAQFISGPEPESDDQPLSATLEWAMERLHTPLTVDELAAHACMSPRTFARRFVDAMGVSPAKWCNMRRVDRARELLETTDLPIEHVATSCGLGSAANLRVHFRRQVGVSPTSYRRTFRVSGAVA